MKSFSKNLPFGDDLNIHNISGVVVMTNYVYMYVIQYTYVIIRLKSTIADSYTLYTITISWCYFLGCINALHVPSMCADDSISIFRYPL